MAHPPMVEAPGGRIGGLCCQEFPPGIPRPGDAVAGEPAYRGATPATWSAPAAYRTQPPGRTVAEARL
jgi:hypothetical protein